MVETIVEPDTSWCLECQKHTVTREGPLVRVICDECGTDREPE